MLDERRGDGHDANVSAIEELLRTLEAHLHSRKRDAVQRISQLRTALEVYERSLEYEFVRNYALEHQLPLPKSPHPSLLEAKRQLLACAAALPPSEPVTTAKLPAPAGPIAAPPTPPAEATRPASERPAPAEPSALHRVVTKARPLVIVGGVAKMDKLQLFPAELRACIEWIETTRQGTHAIGNLANRIRHHRVSVLILLDGLVGHRHTDPLVAAARDAGIVAVYAGKGGQAALARALRQVDKMLGQQASAG